MENKTGGSLLDAAAVLTSLGGEEPKAPEVGQDCGQDKESQKEDFEDDEGKLDGGDCNAKIFPQRLFEVLSDDDSSESICWLPHGRGFIIKDRKRFAAEVLPKYFRQTKFTSFTRKLNRWNFTRITRGPEIGAYYHKFFQRGNAALCTQMYCKNERAKFAKVAHQTEQAVPALPLLEPVSAMSLRQPTVLPPAVESAAALDLAAKAKLLFAASQQQQAAFLASSQPTQATQAALLNAALVAMYRENALGAVKSNVQMPALPSSGGPGQSSVAAVSPAAQLQLALRRNQGAGKFASYRASAA